MQDAAKNILRASGYKATDQRLAILSVFKKNHKPLSAQEVITLLSRDDVKNIDQATVYRTLKSLVNKGIIHPIDLRHNHAHYELMDIADHHHIICLHCGRIEDVAHENVHSMERKVAAESKHFAEIKEHTLEFYGICKKCAKAGTASPRPNLH